MASRGGNPRVSITGDADGVGRATRQAEGHLDRLDKTGGRSLSRLKSAAAGMALAVGAVTAVALKKSVDAAIEAEKTQARLQAQLKASGISFREHAGEIEKVIEKHSQLSGLDDEDLTDAFTNIVRITGDVDKSLRLTGLAADFARAKHMDVAKAGELVGKVAGGNTGILSRYGISVEKGATATEALGLLQQKFGGQAEAYGKTTAGANDRVKVSLENLGESVGQRLTPLLAKSAEGLLKLIDWVSKLGPSVKAGAAAVTGFAKRIAEAFGGGDKDATRFAQTFRRVVAQIIAFGRDLFRSLSKTFEGIGGDLRIIGRAWLRLQAAVWEVVAAITKRTLPILKSAIEGIAGIVRGVVKIVAGILSGDFSKAWDGAKLVVRSAIRGIAGIIKGTWSALGEAMIALAKFLIRQIGKGLSGLAGAVKDAVVAGITKGLDLAGKVMPGIGIGKALVEKLGDGVGRSVSKGYVGGTGAGLDGADADLAPIARLGASEGAHVSSGLRLGAITSSGNPSYHGTGDAIDMVAPMGALRRAAVKIRNLFGPRLRELISPWPELGIKDGRPFRYSAAIQAQHSGANAHLHAAYTGPFGDGQGDGLGRFVATSYGPPWNAMNGTGVTATGVDLKGGARRYGIAVDPSVIPLGSQVKVWPNPFGHRGTFEAFDTGGAIKGNRIDFYDWRGRRAQMGWGSRTVTITTSDDDAAAPATRAAGPSGPAFAFREARANARQAAARAVRNARRRGGPPKGSTAPTGPGKGVEREPATMAEVLAAQPTESDFITAEAARATLTEDPADDLAAATKRRDLAERMYAAALATADPRDDIDAASELKAARDAIEQLTGAIAQQTRRAEERFALDQELAANQGRLIALGERGDQVTAWIIAAVNGGIGGQLGLALQTSGVPGVVARV